MSDVTQVCCIILLLALYLSVFNQVYIHEYTQTYKDIPMFLLYRMLPCGDISKTAQQLLNNHLLSTKFRIQQHAGRICITEVSLLKILLA